MLLKCVFVVLFGWKFLIFDFFHQVLLLQSTDVCYVSYVLVVKSFLFQRLPA